MSDRPALAVGTVSAAAGTRATGAVTVDLGDGAEASIPVAVVNGTRPGPRVAVTAGIHGAEYVSIAALREVAMSLDPTAIRGSLGAVLTANPAAFAARSIYVNPVDGVNLNRQFPGDPAGSASQRLAHWLATSVIAGSDVYVDMHCGDMNEALVSFTGIEEIGDPAVDARARELAMAYGLRYCLVGPLGGSTTTAAAWRGRPASWTTRRRRPRSRPRCSTTRRGCAHRRPATGTHRWPSATRSRKGARLARSRTPSARSSSSRQHRSTAS